MDTAHLASLAAFCFAGCLLLRWLPFVRRLTQPVGAGGMRCRRDALFELCETLLTTGPVPSLPLLSVQPQQHRRKWGSLYDALAAGQMSTSTLESLLSRHPLASGEPIYAVDLSVWPRCDAQTSPGRALYYHASRHALRHASRHASRHAAGQPIVAGWAYSWIAQVGCARESWTAPLRMRRLHPQENANAVAAEQIAAFLPHVRAADPLPWFLFDAGYDPVQLTPALGETPVAILVRLRAGRCFYTDPNGPERTRTDPTAQPHTGRPRRHGHKFAGDDPAT